MTKILRIIPILLFGIIVWGCALAQENPYGIESDAPKIGIYEHLDEYIPEDVILYNKDSVAVNLKQLIDKPTVISFVYYTCPGLCSPMLGGIAEVIERTDVVLGKDYQVVTISIDPTDGPTLGENKKANYVKTINKDLNFDQWIWLTGDTHNVHKISDAVGYHYKKEGKDFIHAAAIVVLSPDGKITRYLHGTYFLPFDLKMAVIEASQEISGPTITKVLKYCFSYDAEGKKYVFNITKVTGTIILSAALLLFLILIIRKRPGKASN